MTWTEKKIATNIHSWDHFLLHFFNHIITLIRSLSLTTSFIRQLSNKPVVDPKLFFFLGFFFYCCCCNFYSNGRAAIFICYYFMWNAFQFNFNLSTVSTIKPLYLLINHFVIAYYNIFLSFVLTKTKQKFAVWNMDAPKSIRWQHKV